MEKCSFMDTFFYFCSREKCEFCKEFGKEIEATLLSNNINY